MFYVVTIIGVIIFILLFFAAMVVLISTHPEEESVSFEIPPLGSVFLKENFQPSGKRIFFLETTVGDITQISEISVYFSNGVINPSLGTLTYSGHNFNAGVYSVPGNNVYYILKISSNISTQEKMIITISDKTFLE